MVSDRLELCAFHTLCITNSFFKTKPQHKVSWRHRRSRHWHQLDLILVRLVTIKNVLHTRSYQRTDCDTYHFLVCCKIRLQPKKFYRSKKTREPPHWRQQDVLARPEQFAEVCHLQSGICIGNSMVCSDICHKYHEWCFEIVIRNWAVRRVKFETILKYHEWYLCQVSRANHAIICLYYYPQKVWNFHM